jgi:hypothetical protein
MVRGRWSFVASLFVLVVFHEGAAAAQQLEVSRIVPSEATVNEDVDVFGKGFGKGTQVYLGDRALTARVISPFRLRVSIPDGARTGVLVVKRNGRVASSQELKIVQFHEPPVIASVSPKVVKPGGLLRIKGRGFGEANRQIYVSVGGAAAEVLERSREVLIVRVPDEATSGAVIVVVSRGGQAIAAMPIRVEIPKVVTRAPASDDAAPAAIP